MLDNSQRLPPLPPLSAWTIADIYSSVSEIFSSTCVCKSCFLSSLWRHKKNHCYSKIHAHRSRQRQRLQRESESDKNCKECSLIETQLLKINNKSRSQLSHVSFSATQCILHRHQQCASHSKHCTASLSVTNFNKQVINHRILKL